jgi:hypothetical protein
MILVYIFVVVVAAAAVVIDPRAVTPCASTACNRDIFLSLLLFTM